MNTVDPMDQKAITFDNVSKRYRKTLPLVDSISFSVDRGEIVALFGPSGSGKSTILQIAAGLVHPDSGVVKIDGKQLFPHSQNRFDASELRNSTISYVSQDDFLFESLNVAENVLLALELGGSNLGGDEKQARVDLTLDMLGIKRLTERRISDISAGERKRVAIARSLITNPRTVIADEPTSSLDLETTTDFLKLVREKAQKEKMTFFLASHDVLEVKSIADRVYGIQNHTLVAVDSRSI